MAGAEKICEFSGEYPGYEMHRFKRNHIQIMPKYRRCFRGAEHVLHVFTPEDVYDFKTGGQIDYDPRDLEGFEPPFVNKKEYDEYVKYFYGMLARKKHDFVLQVFDSELQGDVEGQYMNSSTDMTSVFRRIKRMLRVKELNVVWHSCSYDEWLDLQEQLETR